MEMRKTLTLYPLFLIKWKIHSQKMIINYNDHQCINLAGIEQLILGEVVAHIGYNNGKKIL